ncbi:hypothetical protein CICLE_v10013352mg [Citrus x clementina]|uniref:Uncharacterized protein n=1 Tax=Citrus clementina TaxID=85681 RepID=V4SXG3_CITCL|nr:hypothetical protein CICLE_v10013352mg [Citrus x clementina]
MPASVGGTAGVDTAPVNRRERLASPLYRVSLNLFSRAGSFGKMQKSCLHPLFCLFSNAPSLTPSKLVHRYCSM